MTDLPVIPLFEYADYRLLSQRIGGFVADPMGRVDMWKLWVTTPRSGGTYNYPLQYDVTSLLRSAPTSQEVAHQIYEALVTYDTLADGRVVTVPCLAQSWSANADATVWTVRLRRGVRFQAPVDREVTAADVVADYRFAADPRNHVMTAYVYAVIKGADGDGQVLPRTSPLGVEAPDRYTVRFTLKHPFAAFPDTLGSSSAWVWPVDYCRRVARFEERPVGTGPFSCRGVRAVSTSTWCATRPGGTRPPGSRIWSRSTSRSSRASRPSCWPSRRDSSTTRGCRKDRWRRPDRCRR